MELKRVTRNVELLIPPDYDLEVQEIEYREDPLTGSRCIINPKRAHRTKQSENMLFIPESLSTQGAKSCFFCTENLQKNTPRFSKNIVPEGRITRGGSTLFPNLYPFAEYHAVATFSNDHFVDLADFNQEIILDNLIASQKWMRLVQQKGRNARYPIYMWNYLPPSGASVVHPHVQVLMREFPTHIQKELLINSATYFRANQRSFWHDLITEEKARGERFIGENETLALVASFAPQGFREVQLVFKEASNIFDLNKKQINDLAHAIAQVLKAYKGMGVGSFNLSTFSGAQDEKPELYSLNVKVISRPFPTAMYVNDIGTIERLHGERVIETLPEDVAIQMKQFIDAS